MQHNARQVGVSIKVVIMNDLLQANKHIQKVKTEHLSVKISDLRFRKVYYCMTFRCIIFKFNFENSLYSYTEITAWKITSIARKSI